MKRLTAACLALAALCAPARADEPAPEPVVVPFELLPTQHMAVKVMINGKGPYRLIFDTGAPVNLLNNKVAKEAGVIPKDYRRPLFAPFGSVGQFKIKSLELGNAKAADLPTMVMDHPTVALMSQLMGPLEGIIGFSFFGRYKTTIDYQAKELTFTPTDFEPPDLLDKLTKTLTAPRQKGAAKVVPPAGVWGFRVAKAEGDAEPGVDVTAVLPGSPAADAGLKAGDRLLTLDDSWTDTVIDCYTAAAHVRPGTRARATVRRGEREREIVIEVKAGF